VRDALVSPLDALGEMTRVDLTDEQVAHIRHGRSVPADGDVVGDVALAARGELVAIARPSDGRLRPRKVFL
jgi:hypothetical protein